MKFFVYGMLKSNQPKSWMIPFAKSKPYTLHGFILHKRPEGTAAMVRGVADDYVEGEFREVKWTEMPIIGKLLGKLLLLFLDLSEGTFLGIYRRIKLIKWTATEDGDISPELFTYIFNGIVDNYDIIHKWESPCGA